MKCQGCTHSWPTPSWFSVVFSRFVVNEGVEQHEGRDGEEIILISNCRGGGVRLHNDPFVFPRLLSHFGSRPFYSNNSLLTRELRFCLCVFVCIVG